MENRHKKQLIQNNTFDNEVNGMSFIYISSLFTLVAVQAFYITDAELE